jgi:hypothetical protein
MLQVKDCHTLIVTEPDQQSGAPEWTNKVEGSGSGHSHYVHHFYMDGIGNVEHQETFPLMLLDIKIGPPVPAAGIKLKSEAPVLRQLRQVSWLLDYDILRARYDSGFGGATEKRNIQNDRSDSLAGANDLAIHSLIPPTRTWLGFRNRKDLKRLHRAPGLSPSDSPNERVFSSLSCAS